MTFGASLGLLNQSPFHLVVHSSIHLGLDPQAVAFNAFLHKVNRQHGLIQIDNVLFQMKGEFVIDADSAEEAEGLVWDSDLARRNELNNLHCNNAYGHRAW